MVYCVGLTGDIASGKSTAAQLFSNLDINVIYADKIAKTLMGKTQIPYEKIIAHYGIDIINEEKEINRSQLREIIFSNPQERKWLEDLLHPLIREELQKKVAESTSPYCVVEIPLLITKKRYPYINRVLLIKAPQDVQIARLIQRDRCSPEQAQAIIAAQPAMEDRLQYADDVYNNILGVSELAKTIQHLHYKYLQEAKRDLLC